MISTSAPVAANKYDTTYEESGFNKFMRIFGPIFSTAMLFLGLVIFWVGIGYYYGYWGMFFTGVPRALISRGVSPTVLYTESVGGVYLFSVILATLCLFVTLLPIFLSRKMNNAGWLAGNATLACILLSVATFIVCSTIVCCAYYAVYNHTVLLAGGCPNVLRITPIADNFCYHFLLSYRLMIAGHILTLLPIAWTALVICQQMGKHTKASSTTTYIERRTDISTA